MAEGQFPFFKPVGDSAIVVVFGEQIELALNRRVHAFDREVQRRQLPGVIETVPAYCSLLVHYNLLETDYTTLLTQLQHLLALCDDAKELPSRLVEIPVIYGGERGADLPFVAQHNHLSVEEVIALHSGAEYTVFMMGFTPGFPYLGGMNPAIATPRLETPRIHVPAGSVGIAGSQTGVYPVDSPGGWRLIGYTPLKLFDPTLNPPCLLTPGDRVRFVPVVTEDV
ncbi:MAG: 5-oxoprolinase subunit PxpB [Anaerolineae bacterium]|nr:5-oxoprolinase subunit PxpB [Anaerolineae bacterium]